MGEMISMIAHQWRQPISVIAAIATNIKINQDLGNLKDEKLRNYTDDIDTQVKYLSQTIDDFRNFFKPDKEKENVNLNEAVHHAIKLISKTLQTHNIEVVEIFQEGIQANIYRGEFQQVILNLINNAQDAIMQREIPDGRITVHTEEENDQIKIIVCDNGGGIEKSHYEKIIEPYFTTKGNNGTGLGLYMCRTILETHMDGTLSYYNKDDGACFIISFTKET